MHLSPVRIFHSTRFLLLFFFALILSLAASSQSLPPVSRFLPAEALENLLQPTASFPFSTPNDPSDGTRLLRDSSASLGRESGLVKRVPKGIVNNTPVLDGLLSGAINFYAFPKSITRRELDENDELEDGDVDFDDTWEDEETDSLELRKRQGADRPPRTVYLTVTTCTQPSFSTKKNRQSPPQLTVYISTSAQTKEPGPKSSPDNVRSKALVQGFAEFKVSTTNNLYIGVGAENVTVEDGGIWTYYIAASVDKPYHSYIRSSLNLFMIDSDPNAALLITKNLSSATPRGLDTSAWLKGGPPLSIFVQEKNNTVIAGLHRSFCGLDMRATFPGFEVSPISLGMETGLTTYGGSALEQQFYIPNLNATSEYLGILARSSSGGKIIPGGGGAVYASMTFHTKAQANCAVIFNLTFCSSIAYAVPANPDRYPTRQDLSQLYDSTTAAKYQNFNFSLQQIPCNTTATAQYSLNKTCDDCASSYKKWLCAISIPRCADWIPHPAAAGKAYLQPRNAAQAPIPATPAIAPVSEAHMLSWLATNSSRNNATIAGLVQPGPYAEILPCEDLCYEIVRSCPAAFGFGCPFHGRGLEQGYGVRNSEINGGVSCSEPGAVFGLSAASGLGVRFGFVVGGAVVAVVVNVLL